MHMILTARDTNTCLDIRQREAMRDLEQLQLFDWSYIKQFCNDFFSLTVVSGNYYNPDLGEHLFSKLLRDLVKEIHKSWTYLKVPEVYNNIGIIIQHIVNKLKEKCTYIQIQKQLKNQQYRFCKQIYTSQQYDAKTPKRQSYTPKPK